MRKTLRRAAAAALLSLLGTLWGCAGAPPEEEEPPPPPEVPPVEEVSLELPSSPHRGAFNSVEKALAEHDWMVASQYLDELPQKELNTEDSAYAHYLRARIAWVRGDSRAAREQLALSQVPGSSAGLDYRVQTFEYYMQSLAGEHLAAARSATQIMALAPQEVQATWKRNAWRELQRGDEQKLRDAQALTVDPSWLGWLQLALDSRYSGDERGRAIQDWLQQYPGHPAANPLPGGLERLPQSGPRQDKVALLLPLSGRLAPAGRAVLDGYLAAHLQAANRGDDTPDLLVIDLDEQPSASAAYNSAVQRGAGLVVGPLSKQSVAEIGTQVERPVPVLALNRTDQILPASGGALVQLSLAPEDEAATLAEVAYGAGNRAAMIIAPASAWGEKVERALRTRWNELGGYVVSAAAYGDREDYSRGVKDALGLSASEQRALTVRDMLATNIEFTARRRQDPNVVFLLAADGEQARAIKPLLAFHYAGALPVYTLSSVYSGIPDERNRDLNGITLVEIPWLLGASPELRVALATVDTGSTNYTRLNALGADAYLLQSDFARLGSGPDALLRGNTGLLSMDPQLRIHRELSLATFDGGAIRPR